MKRFLKITLIFSLIMLASCKKSSPAGSGNLAEGEPCQYNEDCQAGMVCRAGICRKMCTNNSDCNVLTHHCENEACLPGSTLACGNGIHEADEECDDGDNKNDDGCSSICRIEATFDCQDDLKKRSICTPKCGNGRTDTGEFCDDNNNADGDGCSKNCTTEEGWRCENRDNAPTVCTPKCGDGLKLPVEGCDDGGIAPGDGCDATCQVEAGFNCKEDANQKSSCYFKCGDGVRASAEPCDDGNTESNDGCSSSCTVEPNFKCTGATGEKSTCFEPCGRFGRLDDELQTCKCQKGWLGAACDQPEIIAIGSQIWMTTNIATTIGIDGSSLTCYANTAEDPDFVKNYGCLYTFADALKVCPTGWHLPEKEEFDTLLTNSGNSEKKRAINLKAKSWLDNELGPGLDKYGFAVLPAGYYLSGSYSKFGLSAGFWPSTVHDDSHAYLLYVRSNSAKMGYDDMTMAYSVRCLSDQVNYCQHGTPDLKTGHCQSNTCEAGYVGEDCEKCKGSGLINGTKGTLTVNDKTYNTVIINCQEWMAENMATKKDKNNAAVTCLTNTEDDANFEEHYGCLYNWADALRVCPDGWHLPTNLELSALLAATGSNREEQSANLRVTSWEAENNGPGTDKYGFSVLPSGYHRIDKGWLNFKNSANFWSSTTSDSEHAYGIYIADGTGIYTPAQTTSIGVRCLKGEVNKCDNGLINGTEGTLTVNGQTYKTVVIGCHKWMAENMASTVGAKSETLTCNVNSGIADFKTKYGCLYNQRDAQKVCPSGWHLPTKAEFSELIIYAATTDSNDNAFLSLIAQDDAWGEVTSGALNYCGFSALPAGDDNDNFGLFACFWGQEDKVNMVIGQTDIQVTSNAFIRDDISATNAFSVRCVEDY